jgi:hypothetical protein
MHREADVPLAGGGSLAGVNPDSDPNLDTVRPLLLGQRTLDRHGRGDCARRAPKRDKERVTLRVDLLAAVRRKRVAHECLLACEHLSVPLATKLLEQAGRAFGIGKHEGDGAAETLRQAPPETHSALGP